MAVTALSRLAVNIRRYPAPAERARSAGRGHRRTAELIVRTLLMPALLVRLLAAMTWLFWDLASDAIGQRGATISVVASVAGAVAFSRCAGWSFVAALILLGFGALVVSIAGLYVMAACALIYGG